MSFLASPAAITSLGGDWDSIWTAMLAGRTATCSTLDLPGFQAVARPVSAVQDLNRSVTGDRMGRFIDGVDRSQTTLFPDRLDDWIDDCSPVRVIDVFTDVLDFDEHGFSSVTPETTGGSVYDSSNSARALHVQLSHPGVGELAAGA